MSTFGQINLAVSDVAASVEFYRLLKVDFPDPYEWPAGSGAEHIDDIHDDAAYKALDNQQMARICNTESARRLTTRSSAPKEWRKDRTV